MIYQVVVPAPVYYRGAVVTVAPPAPLDVVVGVAPTPGYLFRWLLELGGQPARLGHRSLGSGPAGLLLGSAHLGAGGGRLARGHWRAEGR